MFERLVSRKATQIPLQLMSVHRRYPELRPQANRILLLFLSDATTRLQQIYTLCRQSLNELSMKIQALITAVYIARIIERFSEC